MRTESVIELDSTAYKKQTTGIISKENNNLFGYIIPPKNDPQIKMHAKIYSVHKYWSRKPWYPIAECIKKYSKEKDTVVDMFMGSGVTGLEAVIQNRNFIGYDLNPMSIFIAQNTFFADFSVEEFMVELNKLRGKIDPIAKEFYSVSEKCDACGNNLMVKHSNIGPKHEGQETVALFCFSCGTDRTKIVRAIKKNELRNSHTLCKPRISIPDEIGRAHV